MLAKCLLARSFDMDGRGVRPTGSMFNLSAPLNFRGLDPDLPVEVYHRHLPHWRQDGATYFVTFRLADALPQEKLRYLKRLRAEWERTHPPPRSDADWAAYARDVMNRVEAWSDEGLGTCWLRDPQWVDELQQRLHHFQEARYFLPCYVILPNHCHLVMRPYSGHPLETTLQGIKAIVARAINRARGNEGSLWQEESYDRIVRDEEHLWRVVQYIGRNPSKANLPQAQWHRWIHPQWQAAGWRFHDDA